MRMDDVDQLIIGPAQKGLPADSAELSVRALLDRGPHLSDLTTPLLTLDGPGMDANVAVLGRYCAAHGLALAPHGKTTMAPQLWRLQLEAGAWGITVANPAQLAVAQLAQVPRVQLANTLADPHGIALAQSMTADGQEVVSWVDSPAAVRRLQEHLDPTGPQLDVLVELGAPGGRTGARSAAIALEIAHAVQASAVLRLRGVAGYEGALAHDRSDAGLAAVTAYLTTMTELYVRLAEDGLLDPLARAGVDGILTAGGSAYFDLVAEAFADVPARLPGDAPQTLLMLRSGAYIVHDDGFYRGISPLRDEESAAAAGGQRLRSAMHGWARVLSRPEPGLALLDAGKRDLPFDEGLPEAQRVQRGFGAPVRELPGARVTAMNDQHTFLEVPADADLEIGDVVRLGLSHPCTAFDKWRLIPVIDDADAADPALTGLVRTWF
ncbi:amino acid deaminase [Brachybacterium hainanense]|uniref:Amino acid deaminase n=1 Tax=Brachybacterium hainanense TaxID=1541174 RepID=A0ABV6R8E9_9MICO